MENIEKLRVLLQHWIEHNDGHAAEFEKWKKIMTEEGKGSLAGRIGEAVSQMSGVNDILAKALEEAGGPVKKDHDHHHHDHHHNHHHD